MRDARHLHRRNILVRNNDVQISGTTAAALSPLYFALGRLKSKPHQGPQTGVNATSTTNALNSAAVSRAKHLILAILVAEGRSRRNYFEC